jgi:hypothetical protein
MCRIELHGPEIRLLRLGERYSLEFVTKVIPSVGARAFHLDLFLHDALREWRRPRGEFRDLESENDLPGMRIPGGVAVANNDPTTLGIDPEFGQGPTARELIAKTLESPPDGTWVDSGTKKFTCGAKDDDVLERKSILVSIPAGGVQEVLAGVGPDLALGKAEGPGNLAHSIADHSTGGGFPPPRVLPSG